MLHAVRSDGFRAALMPPLTTAQWSAEFCRDSGPQSACLALGAHGCVPTSLPRCKDLRRRAVVWVAGQFALGLSPAVSVTC